GVEHDRHAAHSIEEACTTTRVWIVSSGPRKRREKPMARVRCVTEMGMGVDVHGRDATKAAKRAVSDAIRHSSLGFVRLFGQTPHDMFVDVVIGVPNPEGVD